MTRTTPRPTETTPGRLGQTMVVVLLMLLFLAQLTLGSRHVSLTVDEPSHVINGYAVLTTGELWMVPLHVHPPLVNAWSASPLLLQPERPDPRALPAWERDLDSFIYDLLPRLGPVERLVFVTRYPIMLLAVALMALVYRWARDEFGHWGGLLAVAVMAFDPTMVAHAQLSTTDLGVALFVFASVYLFKRMAARFSWPRWAGVGLLMGAALGAKATGLVLAPAIAGLWIWGYVQNRPRSAGRWFSLGIGSGLLALLTLWAVYGFDWQPLPGASLSLPLVTHVRLLQSLQVHSQQLTFVAGMRRYGGDWWYFPFVFAIKTPIPVIVALAATLASSARRGRHPFWRHAALWLFPLLYLAVAISSGMNIGFRHLLPTFPFAYVAIGRLGRWLARPMPSARRRVARWAAIALGAWYAIGTVRVMPFPIAYFNELIGGPRNGYRFLADSNVDWGQSFLALRAYMEEAGIEEVRLSHHGWVDPAAYGVRYQPLLPAPEVEIALSGHYDPPPGVYAISATTLQGVVVDDPDTFEWFRNREPIAQPGYGLLVYRVERHDPPASWLAQCNIPLPPLTDEAIRTGFARDDLRTLAFDCTQGWVYPGGGASGWYRILRHTWQESDDFAQQQLAHARLSYEQERAGDVPPFVLFEWPGQVSGTAGLETAVRVAPAGWPPTQVEAERAPVDGPVGFDGPLTFLGYRRHGPEVWTYWRVEGVAERPLSIMAHRVGADNVPNTVHDGLAVAIDAWRVGDVLAQRHNLAIDGPSPEVDWIHVGVYWLDTLERWSVAGDPSADRLLLVR